MANQSNCAGPLEDKLVELVDQIEHGGFEGPHGEAATNLQAFHEAKTFLEDELRVDVHERARALGQPTREAYARSLARQEGEEAEPSTPSSELLP